MSEAGSTASRRRHRSSSRTSSREVNPTSAHSIDPSGWARSGLSIHFGDPVLYRNESLSSANIFINRLKAEYWPAPIRTLIHGLRAFDPDMSSSSANNALALRDSADALAHKGWKYTCSPKVRWMSYNMEVLNMFNHKHISSCIEEAFDVPVGPNSRFGLPLLTPTPDLAFGLAVQDADVEFSFTDVVLKDLRRVHGVQPFPSTDGRDLAFPCIIYEARSDCGNLLVAGNSVAHGAAKALAMAQTLRDSYESVTGTQAPPRLPVIAICSMGDVWEVFLAFDLQSEEIPSRTDPHTGSTFPVARDGVHLVRVWLGAVTPNGGDDTQGMFQLKLLLQRVLQWTLHTWRPNILGMLDALRLTLPDRQ